MNAFGETTTPTGLYNVQSQARGQRDGVAGAQAMARAAQGRIWGTKVQVQGVGVGHLSCPKTQLKTESSWSGDRLPQWGHYGFLLGYQLCCRHWAPRPPSCLSASNSLYKITVQIYICGWIFLDVSTFFLMFFSFLTAQTIKLPFLCLRGNY